MAFFQRNHVVAEVGMRVVVRGASPGGWSYGAGGQVCRGEVLTLQGLPNDSKLISGGLVDLLGTAKTKPCPECRKLFRADLLGVHRGGMHKALAPPAPEAA